MFAVILTVFAAIDDVLDVILAVFAAIDKVLEVILTVLALIEFVFVVIKPGKVAIVVELTPPTLFTVVTKLPLPEPVTSPVKVVVKFAAITSVPIANPKFVLASAAVVAPVPPFNTAREPLIFAEVILLSATPAFALC